MNSSAEIFALLLTALSYVLALMLLVAAAEKLLAWPAWQSALAAYRLVPGAIFPVAAFVIPATEAAAAVSLMTGARPAGPAAGAALMLLYAAAMAINLKRGRIDLDCGCNPAGRAKPIAWGLVGRNLALAGLFGLAALPLPSVGPWGHMLAAASALAAFAAIRTAAFLADLAPPTATKGPA